MVIKVLVAAETRCDYIIIVRIGFAFASSDEGF